MSAAAPHTVQSVLWFIVAAVGVFAGQSSMLVILCLLVAAIHHCTASIIKAIRGSR